MFPTPLAAFEAKVQGQFEVYIWLQIKHQLLSTQQLILFTGGRDLTGNFFGGRGVIELEIKLCWSLWRKELWQQQNKCTQQGEETRIAAEHK